MTTEEEQDEKFFKKLKSKFYSMYEADQELQTIDAAKHDIMGVDEYDYVDTVKSRKTTLQSQILELLKPYEQESKN